jgi:flagellar motility protein MotE (MotC chaperone)
MFNSLTKSLLIAPVLFAGLALTAQAEEQPTVNAMQKSLVSNVAPGSDKELELFCANIEDSARERRYALQRAQLEELKAELEERIKLLDDKQSELKVWVEKREEFARMASSSVVDVYANMPPDSAAERLANMEGGLSAALLMKLKSRVAAAILSEMEPRKASMVTSIMAASSDKTTAVRQ